MTPFLSSLRIRLTLMFGSLAFVIGLAIALYINYFVSARMTETKGDSIQKLANSISLSISENLKEREREVSLLAQSPSFMHANLQSAELQKQLERTKNTYRHYAWIGVTDAHGIVQSSSDHILEGQSVALRQWYISGLKSSFFGDIHEAILLSKYLSPNQNSSSTLSTSPTSTASTSSSISTPKEAPEPLRFVDFSAPIFDENGKVRGVLGAHAHWRWVDEIIQRNLPNNAKQSGENAKQSGDNASNGIEIFIVNKNNDVLSPFSAIGKITMPLEVASTKNHQILTWPDQTSYLVSSIPIELYGAPKQFWRVVVRQPINKALSNVNELHHQMWLLGLVATSILMLLVYWLSRVISAPIEQLSTIASKVADGDNLSELNVSSNTHELKILIASLNAMTARLAIKKRELININDQLEHKVEERTAELKKSNLELASLAQKLDLLARQDTLTALNNRMCADEHLQKEHARMLRTQSAYCILLMDIDYFKKINDNFGHAIGDQVLQRVSTLLKSVIRTSDVVARFGGEEFLCILPETSIAGGQILADKICRMIAAHDMPECGRVTISIGVALSSIKDKNAGDVVKRADQAMYLAKENGRNQVVIG